MGETHLVQEIHQMLFTVYERRFVHPGIVNPESFKS
jgi:hypothetical protein